MRTLTVGGVLLLLAVSHIAAARQPASSRPASQPASSALPVPAVSPPSSASSSPAPGPGQPAVPASEVAPDARPPASSPAPPAADPPMLVVADGQIESRVIQVFATVDITLAMGPKLHLTGALRPDGRQPIDIDLTPTRAATGQYRTVDLNGTPTLVRGTVLLFDRPGERIPIPAYKPAIKLLPDLEWQEPAAESGKPPAARHLVAQAEIFLGNLAGAALWTAVVLGLLVGVLLRWSWTKSQEIQSFEPLPWALLITGPDGYLSLWRAQLAAWTLAVAGVVFLFGLLRLHVPNIPESLICLMGMSLLTGSMSAKKAKDDATRKERVAPGIDPEAALAVQHAVGEARQAADRAGRYADAAEQSRSGWQVLAPGLPVTTATPPTPAAATAHKRRPQWADLISLGVRLPDGRLETTLSLPKAQMVLWTVIILTLFIAKSLSLGELWPVPWEMVALTGFSQAGYIGDKFVGPGSR